jgi:hypothetical protein
MEYGEIKKQSNTNFSTPSEGEVVFKENDVEISLWSANKAKYEIYPPSKSVVYITKKKIICKKKRRIREKETIIGPPGYPYPATLHLTRKMQGLQWIVFKINEITNMGRTYLLDHVIKINSNLGDYELIISKGKQAKQLILKVKKCIEDK